MQTTIKRELIGYWIQKEEEQVPYLGEYAGHNEEWRLHVGETAILRCTGPGWRKWVTAQRPATRISYNFWNRIGAHGSMQVDNEPKLGTHSVQMDAFDLARAVDRGVARLVEGYEVVTVKREDGSDWLYPDGKPMRQVRHADGRRFEL